MRGAGCPGVPPDSRKTDASDDQQPRPVDTDGVVPYGLECPPLDDWGGRHYGHWETVDGEVVMEREVALNWCRLALQGAGPLDIHRVLAHERAHASGWRHCEGTREENAAYYPDAIRITGL